MTRGTALVVSSSDRASERLRELLRENGLYEQTCAGSGGEARRRLLEREYDLILINAPLGDEFGQELACQAAAETRSGILMLCRSQQLDALSERVEQDGVLVVEKPVSPAFFYQACRLALSARTRLGYLAREDTRVKQLERENVRLRQKVEEIRLMSRAKYALMQYLNMSEAQAHRYIEKQAMDTRMTRRAIAESIIKTYEM